MLVVWILGTLVGAAVIPGPVVTTSTGPVQGLTDTNRDVDFWWSIPFAAPPVGNNRFRRPQPPKKWTSTLVCNTTPPVCPQLHVVKQYTSGNEDCLYLNVYRPRNVTATSRLPVMFWIFGGGFVIGDSYGALNPGMGSYDGRLLAQERNVVIVSANYRLNALGWMALDAFKEESGSGGSSGNYGLQDQRAALQWTQDNIHRFGGDPKRVLLFGESAGGISVLSHVVNPSTRGLYHFAIAESPIAAGDLAYMPWEQASAFGQVFTEFVHCNRSTASETRTCLRDLPLASILNPLLLWPSELPSHKVPLPKFLPALGFWPVVDGSADGLPMAPIDAVKSGKWSPVPLGIGTNRDEGSAFLGLLPLTVRGADLPLTSEGYRRSLLHFFNESTMESILKEYPEKDFRSNDERAALTLRDFFFACPARKFLHAVNSDPKSPPAYRYYFNFTMDDSVIRRLVGDYHSAEVQYVWGHSDGLHKWKEADEWMAAVMGDYWSHAATTGTPTPPDQPTWPPYTASHSGEAGDNHIVFDKPLRVGRGLYEERCDFWDTVGYGHA